MNRVCLIVSVVGMLLLFTQIADGKNVIGVQSNIEEDIVEKREIVPYPVPSPQPIVPVVSIEKMPYVQQHEGRLHIIPYFRFGPNQHGRGLGTQFGFRFGLFRSHNLGLDINLF